uniref:Uncharacterized protein n=1 Tax=Spermophilus dauricus TaxID=99837 RepID=A0A8C9QNC3_SPEDA
MEIKPELQDFPWCLDELDGLRSQNHEAVLSGQMAFRIKKKKELRAVSYNRHLAFIICFDAINLHIINTKFNPCLCIPTHELLRGCRPATHPLWTVPVHVPGHSAWEPAHHSGCQL